MTPLQPILPLCICGEPLCKIPYGYCHCGCGKKTNITQYSRKEFGYIAGMPRRFCKGHSRREPMVLEHGPGYRVIQLTQGKVTKVSIEDYERYKSIKMIAKWERKNQTFYAVFPLRGPDGKRRTIYLHRDILGLAWGDKRQVDHRFHDSLDNRRCIDGKVNLRIATPTENQNNSRKRKDNKSGYKGVCFHKNTGKWMAQINVNGKHRHLGLFETPELAYAAYCKAAFELRGEFACVE